GEDRIFLRSDAVRRRVKALAQRHGELVVDPTVPLIPRPGIAVLSRNEDVVGAGHALKILSAPRIDLANRHWHPYVRAVHSEIATAALQPAIVVAVADG